MIKLIEMNVEENKRLMAQIDRIAEVAGYLWEKGWAERNGGNISVDVTDLTNGEERGLPSLSGSVCLPQVVPALGGRVFFVTGAGKRMRYVAQEPFANGSLIRIAADGASYDIIATRPVIPTSELPSHLLMHDYLRGAGKDNKVVLHTHPTDLIGLTHCKPFRNARRLTRLLWSMIPECRLIVPRGIGIVPYERPGTVALARATVEQLKSHEVVFWEKHGVLATGEDVIDCFDAIDTLSKSAQIYFSARQAGYEPDGLTDRELDELAEAFSL